MNGMQKNVESLLSPAQWLPKPATRWLPQLWRPLRGTWSSRVGERETRKLLLFVFALADAFENFEAGFFCVRDRDGSG